MQANLQGRKIFGIGLSRTGTKSLTSALETLGLKISHFPTDRRTFKELYSGHYNLSILGDVDGITDVTVAPYYAQLEKVFPDALFILTEREKEATSFIHHWSGSPKIWTRTNYWWRSWPVHEESWTRIGGFVIDDGCRCGRHVNIPENFDILLIIMLSQSILIRPLKSLIGVNNWRRCDTPMNVDVMSWMASICRTLVRAEFGKNTWSFATLWAVVKNDPLPCLIEIDETANSCLLITTFATRRWETEQQRGFCWPECDCRNLTH